MSSFFGFKMNIYYKTSYGNIYMGNCYDVLNQMPDNSIDLIITSPPYADSRKYSYGGTHPDNYVKWFMPISNNFLRILKPEGTFILNIKERVFSGERHTYVIELILELRKQGWIWTEEFIWHKANSYPGKWPNRFRDAWERCLQFNKIKKFNMYQDSVMVPIGDWSKQRLANLSEKDKLRQNSNTGSKFSKNISKWENKNMVYPTNVLHLPTECGNKKHSAAFPESLPEWFIKLFTKEGDAVLDPFMGSGTVAVVCERLNRKWIGIEKEISNCETAKERINKDIEPQPLF